MNKFDVRMLQSVEEFPCLSILLPTKRFVEFHEHNRGVIKNAVAEAHKKIKEECKRPEAQHLASRLDELVKDIDPQHLLDGLAIFISPRFEKVYRVPLALTERIIIDKSFHVRDLVRLMQIEKPYWVLCFDEHNARLFNGIRDHLIEVVDDMKRPDHFPLAYQADAQPFERLSMFTNHDETYQEAHRRSFFKKIDRVLAPHIIQDVRPLVVVASGDNRALFEKVTEHGHHVYLSLGDDYDALRMRNLELEVWKAVEKKRVEDEKGLDAKLQAAQDRVHYAEGIHEVWRMAYEGRIHELFVEHEYVVHGQVDRENPTNVFVIDNSAQPDETPDLIEELITLVSAKDGQVTFVSKGLLKKRRQIAAILRY